MKTRILVVTIGAGLLLAAILLSGCTAWHSGNLNAKVNTAPYLNGKDAVTKREVVHVDPKGNVTKDVMTVTETGPAVASKLDHHRLDVLDDVGTAQANTPKSQGLIGWLSSPTPVYYGGSGYNNNFSPHIGGGGGAGGFIVSVPGGGNRNFYPHIGW